MMQKKNCSSVTKFFKISVLLMLLCIESSIFGQNKQNGKETNPTIVEFRLENDFVFATDVYFTQGLFLKVFAPFADKNPLNALLLPFGETAKVYHGISIIQNLYTPVEKSDSIITNDRPFSAYLMLQNTRIALYKKERQKVVSTLKLGVIGPPALGEEMQNGIHSLLPASSRISGWQNQIKTDVLINYSVQYEKGILHNSFFDLDFKVFGNVGMPYTNMGSGINFRIGEFNNYFAELEFSKHNKWQYYISFNSNFKYVIYDATLQGGLFNKTSIQTIYTEDVNNFVGQAKIFGNLSCNNYKLKFGAVFITQEFKNGVSHNWGVLSIIFGL